MFAIALRHGIDLEDLQAANPEVNPRLLSVGTVLVIPLGEIIPAVPMTATPIPVTTSTPDCYVVPDGIWCFLNVTNDRSRPLENISARIVLYNQTGEVIGDEIGIAALNLVPVKEAIPLVVFFPGSQTDVLRKISPYPYARATGAIPHQPKSREVGAEPCDEDL